MNNPTALDDQILAALRRIARAIDVHSRDLLQQCGLTVPQLLTVRALTRLEPINVSDLASTVSVSQATMSGILERLEEQGLISRTRHEEDRRNTVIRLTDSGRQFIEKAPPILHDRFRSELGELAAWEQTAMLATLQRIATMMGAGDWVTAPILTSGAESLVDPGDMPK